MRKYLTFYENQILSHIYMEGTDFDKVQAVYKAFDKQQKYKGGEDTKTFIKWLKGSPKILQLPKDDKAIIRLAEQNGFEFMFDALEENFLSMYWQNMAQAFFTLKNNL